MDELQAQDVRRWRRLDRHVQSLSHPRQVRAQAVLDTAEDVRLVAAGQGGDPVDYLLELHHRVKTSGSKQIVADAVSYLRAEVHLARREARAS